MGMAQSINHSLIYLSGRPTIPRFELIVITWDNPLYVPQTPSGTFLRSFEYSLTLRYMERQGILQNRHTEGLHLHPTHPQDY